MEVDVKECNVGKSDLWYEKEKKMENQIDMSG